MTRDELSTLTDGELLAAIRRGDVRPAAAREFIAWAAVHGSTAERDAVLT